MAAAVLAAACSNVRSEGVESPLKHGTRHVSFHACESQTRTAFGQGQDGVYPTLWTANDASVKIALNYSKTEVAGIVPSEDFLKADFGAEFNPSDSQAPYTFYAVSPASAAKALSPSRQAWNITIPSVQTPLAGSVDEAAMIIAAASQPADQMPADVNLHFNHLTAYGRMSFTNLNLGGATVNRVEMTATTPFVGDWYWDCTEEHVLTDNGASSTLTLNTSSTADIWFACAPVDMSEQIVIFTIYTDQGLFVKEVEFPQNRKFVSGHIAVFSVDMNGIEMSGAASNDYVLVTDASVLSAGDEILILNADETYAISTNQKQNNRDAAEIDVTNHSVSSVPEDVQVITLLAGSTSGTWHLDTGSGYLANASGDKNKLVTVDSKTKNATWTISIKNNGVATITAGDGGRNILRFNPNTNNGNPLFACYKSGQEDVVIFRKGAAAAAPVDEDPLTANRAFGIYQDSDTRAYVPGADQFSRSYSDNGVQTFTILNPATNEQLEITGYKRVYVKGDAVNITVNWRKGLEMILSDKTYSVQVVKEEGPIVWLGNGSGNGFIIKK